MKNTIKLILIAILSLYLTSCGTKSSDHVNSIITLSNEALSNMDDFSNGEFSKSITEFEQKMKSYEIERTGSKLFSSPVYSIFGKESLYKSIKTDLSALETEHINLTTNVTSFMKIIDGLEENSKTLSDYLDAEDYEEDEFKKGHELLTSINTDISSFYDLHNKIASDIDAILKDSESAPSNMALANMDADLDEAYKIYQALEKTENIADVKSIESDYKSLEENLNKHLKEEVGLDILQSMYESYYTSTFKSYSNGLKKLIRDSKNNELQEDDYQERLANLLISYNNCVDSYNLINEQIGYGIK